jgi:hypothetical protein
MNSILYMYLHVLLQYNARDAARASCQLTRRRVEFHDLTQPGVVTRPIIEFDWGESCVRWYRAQI